MDEPKSMYDTMSSIFKSKKGADITFVIHGKELPAHSLIVASRSPVLEAMINSDLAPKNGKHLIDDPQISYEDFDNFLEFLYTDDCEINENNVEKLLHLSNFYSVKYLLNECVNNIKEWFTTHNILKFAELGFLYSETCDLLNVCLTQLPLFGINVPLKYIAKDGSNQWILPELVFKIVEKCQRNNILTEEALFQNIVQWSTKGNNDNINPENLKSMIKPLMPYIKFEDLEPYTLSTIVQDNHLLDDSVLLNVLSKAVKKAKNLEEKTSRKRIHWFGDSSSADISADSDN